MVRRGKLELKKKPTVFLTALLHHGDVPFPSFLVEVIMAGRRWLEILVVFDARLRPPGG